jgi:hypothetical protein
MKINIAYHQNMYLEPITPIAEELSKRRYKILHNSPEGVITIGSHITDLVKWKNKTPLVFIDHGVLPRKGNINDIINLIKLNALILFSGKYYERLINKIDPAYKNFKITGNPKLEYFLKDQIPRNQVIKKYDLDPGKPIILYAPTWYHKAKHKPYSHGTIKYIKKIEKACMNYNKKKYIKYASIIELKDRTMYYFSASDLLISDFSTIMIDYCYFNKPIIQITNVIDRNIRKYKDKQQKYVKLEVGEFTKARKLKNIIDLTLKNPDAHKIKREEWFKDVVKIVKGSSKLTADVIEEYIRKIK